MSIWRERGNAMAWAGSALCAWLLAWRHLSVEWSLNEQYQFGWGIPFLFLWMVGRRWETSAKARCGASRAAFILAAVGWMLMGVGTLAVWKDPIWRMTGALLALGAVLVTAGFSHRLGGWPTVRRQAFSLAFSCFAVPWPVRLDSWITQHLLRMVTAISVAFLNTAGIPALQHVNVIELRNGIVGIEEACSGISSLQASLVASVFLGEYFRLSIGRRVALGIGGLLACMSGNLLRVLGIVFVVHRLVGSSAQQWHNSIGGAASVFSFLYLGLMAYGVAGRGWKAQMPSEDQRVLAIPGGDGWVVLGLFIALPLGTWAAFHTKNSDGASHRATWNLDYSHLPKGWTAAPIEPAQAAAASLHFTRWESCGLLSPTGWSAQVTHLFWASNRNIPGTAFYHTPALCLSGSGWSTAAETETWKLEIRGQRVSVNAYHLAGPDRSLVVAIQSLSQSGDAERLMDDLKHPAASVNRFALLWRGRARRVDEEILAYMPDLGSSDLQRKAFAELLSLTLVPTPAN